MPVKMTRSFLFVVCFCQSLLSSALPDDVRSSMTAAVDTNVALACSDVKENTYVLLLVWKCRGTCSQAKEDATQAKEDATLVKFTRGRGVTEQKESRFVLDEDTFDLNLTGVTEKDDGEYFCVVNNKEDVEDRTKLKVIAPPLPPSRPLVTGFTSRTVSLSWIKPKPSPNSPGEILSYLISVNWKEVNEDDNVEFRSSALGPIQTNSTQTSTTVTGLQPYTVYNFQVQAITKVGKSKRSKPSYPAVTPREKPSGKPQVTAAHNTSATSVYLEWQPPPPASIHGEFQGYIVTYRPRDTQHSKAKELRLPDPKVKSYTLEGLDVYTQYLVSVKVFNPEGSGPDTIVVVMTDEGAPSAPRNIRILSVTDTSIQLSWWEPARANGVLQGYRLYFLQHNQTSVQTVPGNKSATIETLTRLKPYQEYKIWIRAYTSKHEGKPSEEVKVTTDVQPPGKPTIVNLTCQSGNTMFVKWIRPVVFYRTVDVYYVLYRARRTQGGDLGWQEQEVETVNNTINHMMYLNNLTTNVAYEVKIRAGTRSHLGDKKLHLGDWSEIIAVFLQPGCENLKNYTPEKSEDRIIVLNLEEHLGMIAGVICGALGLLLLIFAVLLCKRYKQDSSYYYDEEKYYSSPEGPVEIGGWDLGRVDEPQHAIPVHLFPKHVMELHMNQEVGFAKEYEEIRAASCLDEFAAQDSQNPDNQEKNRYPNIVAFDHTRVRLKSNTKGTSDPKEKDEYLNANYVDGFRKAGAYIATQGPMKGTIDLYWRMVYEQKSTVIVMITHLVENGKAKCDQYWPGEGSAHYGDLSVTILREDVLAFYTLRTFAVRPLAASGKKKKSDVGSELTVYQYHYTAWPDHGVPLHALPLITFVRNSAAANPEHGGPIVVHCSAGVGRTGCYIVIHAMLQQIISRADVDVFSYLLHIRRQRNHLVQTEEQYLFIHDALVEAIEAGETHITKSCLPKYIHSLQCIDVTDDKQHPMKVLEKQYKLVCAYHAGKTQYSTALKICNQSKNRSADLLPTDSHRVFLSPGSDCEGSDYINASWLTGFYNRKGFMVSQHPLENTVSALWQMVAEQDVRVIVVLSPLDNEECSVFWPQSPGSQIRWDAGFNQYTVSMVTSDDYQPRTIRLQLESGDCVKDVVVIQCSNWPQQCSPLSTVFDLVKLVDEEAISSGSRNSHPVLVIDRHGGSQAASFCCLMSLWHQLEFEGCVDLFQLARLYHYSRPGVWRSQADYLFLYCALEAYITNNGTSIPSPVDLDQWRNGYQLNGCVRVSKVYTDSVGERVSKVFSEAGLTDSLRVPPDGQESASLLKNVEMADSNHIS